MYNSKLIDIFQVLNGTEKEALKKWIKSPTHNRHQKSTELLSYLLSKRNLTARTSDRHQVFKDLYPNEKYHDPTIKHLMSYCVRILEEFIEFLMQKKTYYSDRKNLIEFFSTRQLHKYAEQTIQKVQIAQRKDKIQNRLYFDDQYHLEEVLFEHQNFTTRSNQTNLQAILNNQYLAFVLGTLNYACEVITHQRLYKSTYEIPLLEPILVDLKAGKHVDIPAIQLYYYSYMTLSCPEEETYFQTLRDLLVQHHDALPAKEIKSIYLIAINHCVQRLNSGLEQYVQTVFELFQHGLTYNILIEEQKLNQFTYKNIITAALRLEKFEWTSQFITDYTPYLEPIYQDNYALFAKSKLLFAQKEYEGCLSLLAKVEFDDLFLNMNAKSMLLKIYYEEQHFDALDALIVSFRRFLQRKSIVAYQRKIYENMITLTEKILTLPIQDKQKQQALRLEIEATNPLTEKPWLLAQLDNI